MHSTIAIELMHKLTLGLFLVLAASACGPLPPDVAVDPRHPTPTDGSTTPPAATEPAPGSTIVPSDRPIVDPPEGAGAQPPPPSTAGQPPPAPPPGGEPPPPGGQPGIEPIDQTIQRDLCPGAYSGRRVSKTFGRLDGELVAIALPRKWKPGCRHDRSHVHLVVLVDLESYDIAINVDGVMAEIDAAMPGQTWDQGWHTDVNLDYPSSLGVHSNDFRGTEGAESTAKRIEAELVTTSTISVFGTGYGPEGAHNVHRRGRNHDGALVLNPKAPKARMLLFSFENRSF